MSNRASSSNSMNAVTVIWDNENTWIPDNYDIRSLKANIETALKKRNPSFFIETMIAYGPQSGEKYREICKCPDIVFKPIPKEDMRCDASSSNSCYGFVVRNSGDSSERIMRKTDVADAYAMKEMFMKALKNETKILIITGDIDFFYAVKGLYEEGVYIMIALLENSSRELIGIGNATWLWKSEDPGKATMIRGGAPFHQKASK